MTHLADDDNEPLKAYIIVNKEARELYNVDTLTECAHIVSPDGAFTETLDDIRWQLKRTGRYDREDGVITIILATPQE